MDRRLLTILAAVVIIAAAAVVVYGLTRDGGPSEGPGTPGGDAGDGTLVLYFSVTGNTERAAEQFRDVLGCDIAEIVPDDPYPPRGDDLNARATSELLQDARPGIAVDADMSGYDTVVLLYPIWNGAPPMAVLTFLDGNDLAGKDLYVCCTSGGSPLGVTMDRIEASTSADVHAGLTFSEGDTAETMRAEASEWLSGLGLIG